MQRQLDIIAKACKAASPSHVGPDPAPPKPHRLGTDAEDSSEAPTQHKTAAEKRIRRFTKNKSLLRMQSSVDSCGAVSVDEGSVESANAVSNDDHVVSFV